MSESYTKQIGGIEVTVLPTDQFKLTTIGVQFLVPLEENAATARALLPYVMMRGSESFPTSERIQKELASLYGANLGFGVAKKGNVQIPTFTLRMVNEKFLGDEEDVFTKSVTLLCDILFRPRFEDGKFPQAEFDKEKDQHKKRIESLFDDKIAYASDRCQQELGKGYAFSIPRQGTVESLTKLTSAELTDTYHDLFKQAKIQIMIVGDVLPSKVFEVWEREIPVRIAQETEIPKLTQFSQQGPVKEIVEHQDINQGKLNIGYGTSVSYESDEYPALIVYNSILGGSATSKLFTNVREKASLCYYVGSRLDAFTATLFIQSGIEVENYEKAKTIIDQQVSDMKMGNITETELQYSKNALINQYRTANDSPETAIDLSINGLLTKRIWTLDSIIEAVEKVSLADVTNIAQKIQEDTIYFLRN